MTDDDGITRAPESYCPHCGKAMNSLYSPTHPGATPSAGDVTVCMGCAAPLVVTEGLGHRVMTPEDVDNLDSDVGRELMRVIEAIEAVNAMRN